MLTDRRVGHVCEIAMANGERTPATNTLNVDVVTSCQGTLNKFSANNNKLGINATHLLMAAHAHIVSPKPGYKHTSTVIFLHGRGSTCEEFAAELFESEASQPVNGPRTLPDLLPTVRWVFPRAPVLRSERFDEDMSQWFDIWSVEDPDSRPELQQPGLRASISMVLDIIRAEEALVSRTNIFLAGISQGFATAIAAFFAGGQGLAGLVGLCSWMPQASRSTKAIVADGPGADGTLAALQKLYYDAGDSLALSPAVVRTTPVLLGHSSDDDVVPVENGRRLRDTLELLLDSVEWHEYDTGGHWLEEPHGIDDIVSFLQSKCTAPLV